MTKKIKARSFQTAWKMFLEIAYSQDFISKMDLAHFYFVDDYVTGKHRCSWLTPKSLELLALWRGFV